VHDLYPHDPAVAQRLAAMDVLWQSPGTQVYETPITLAGGTHRDTVYYKATFTGPDGNVAGLIGNIIDVTEQKRAERRLRMEHAVTRVLAEAESTQAGLKGVMRAICEAEDWDCARVYLIDEHAGVLRFSEAWGIDHEGVTNFIERTSDMVFSPGQGLAGRAWQTGEPYGAALSRPTRAGPALRLRLRQACGLSSCRWFRRASLGSLLRQPRARARRAAARGGRRGRQPGRAILIRNQAEEAALSHPRRAQTYWVAEPRHVRAAPGTLSRDAARAAPAVLHRSRPLQDHQRHVAGDALLCEVRAAFTESPGASDTVARLMATSRAPLEELSGSDVRHRGGAQAARHARPAGMPRARVPRHRQHRRQRLPRRLGRRAGAAEERRHRHVPRQGTGT
jgi:hypothetical protein